MAAPAGLAALRLVTGNIFLEISNSSAINSRRCYRNNVQPKVVENRIDMPAPMLRRPRGQAKSWLARAHRKSIPLRKLER
jgi:hypothetical protein